jgi:hypothetical protein
VSVETPWDDEEKPPGEQGLVEREGPPLHDVYLRFGVSFPSDDGALAFTRAFGFTYTRSASTARGRTAWLIFRCAATDAGDAALQAAVAVRRITDEKRTMLGSERPQGTHFHDARVAGPVKASELVRAHQEREEALARARAWGLTYDSLVVQAEGQPMLEERRQLPTARSPVPSSQQISSASPPGYRRRL